MPDDFDQRAVAVLFLSLRYLQATGPDDAVLTVGLAAFPLARYYELPWPEITGAADLRARLRQSDSWLVYPFPAYIAAADPELRHSIELSCNVQESFPAAVRGGELVVSRCSIGSQARQ